jgi:hypothetical protein
MAETLHCKDCGEVIGVYEPLVTLVDGHPREISQAADPHVGSHTDECFHRACFERRHGDRHGDVEIGE